MSVDTAQSIPDSFCPGKWDELCLNLNYNYAYGCCAATPLVFVKDYKEVLDPQKKNMLSGIKDSTCDHCWKIEDSGGISKRPKYFKNFNESDYESYKNGTAPVKILELNVGNECNFQCIYCNPKYSSQWEADVKKQTYQVYTDRFNYTILDKTDHDLVDINQQVLAKIGPVIDAKIIGGEPLQNKNLWPVLDSIVAERLIITTNLSCKKETIDKLLEYAKTKFKSIRFQISLDATKEVSEFVRHGMDYSHVVSNIEYVLSTAPGNVLVTIASTISSLTVRDLKNFTQVIEQWQIIRPGTIWTLSYCSNPKIQSFSTLPIEFRNELKQQVEYIDSLPNIEFLETIKSALNVPYSQTMHKELKHFMKQFATRKKIEIPSCLE